MSQHASFARVFAGTLAALAMCAAMPSGQSDGSRGDPSFSNLVHLYRAGQVEEAVSRLFASDSIRRGSRSPDENIEWIRAAVMLRTEVAFRLWQSRQFNDGANEFARARSGLKRCGGDFSRRWYLATIAFFQSLFDLAHARMFLDNSGYGNEPEFVITAGLIDEASTSPMAGFPQPAGITTHSAGTTQTDLRVGNVNSQLGVRARRLGAALTAFSNAHQALPLDREATLHFGKVLMDTGDLSRGRQLLEASCRDRQDVATAYLGCIFLARLEEAERNYPGAEDAYRDALQRNGPTQSGCLGLGLTQFSAGRRVAAAETLRTCLGQVRADSVDPWWFYYRGYAARLNGWLDELRQMARD
jgi:hypothetical protein